MEVGATVVPRGKDGFAMTVELPERTISNGRVERKCDNPGCKEVGKWRMLTRNYLCPECRKCPAHKLICRTTAKRKYGLSYDELHAAHKAERIHMFTVTNPHNASSPPMRLYYEHEVSALASNLHGHSASAGAGALPTAMRVKLPMRSGSARRASKITDAHK